jgi:hypothetical protein
MAAIGYIVQQSDEEAYTVYTGHKKLFRLFSHALDNAKAICQSYLESHDPAEIHPFQSNTPSKKDCDNQGSVVVFENRSVIIWIDCVVE